MPQLTDTDRYLFNEGRHLRLYEKLGAHLENPKTHAEGRCHFAVWAPNAAVSVLGDFNAWQPGQNVLSPQGETGIHEGFVNNVRVGQRYIFQVASKFGGYKADKADPFAFSAEIPPKKASVVTCLDYVWSDAVWLVQRRERNSFFAPCAIYEMHLGSWQRKPDGTHLSFRELAPRLCEYLHHHGFTHVEFLPVMEHPFYGSWGYQCTGYFAPTSRYGTPQDFMFLVDSLHQANIGVILDWVPSHFPADEHGLGFFDGTHLFEHADRRQGFHPDWHSLLFNYGRNEVRSFLLSNAMFWLDRYHVDGLRVDAVASMLYLDYSRKMGEWIPNRFGGRENLEAISFLRQLSEDVYREFPDVQLIAEESTSWPQVTRPTSVGGLGFGYKWDMGFMHDTLKYFSLNPVHRAFHHNLLTFRAMYATSENFILSISHDEVVHLKGSLLSKMGGPDADAWQKRASLRLLLGYQWALPGKKLLFMGAEFGQWREWNHETALDWFVLDSPEHAALLHFVSDLNRVYREQPALFADDFSAQGFEWLVVDDQENSVLAFLRHGKTQNSANGKSEPQTILVVCNFTPVPRDGYRIGMSEPGRFRELLNSDATEYAGSGLGNLGGVVTEDTPAQGKAHSLCVFLPPLAVTYFLKIG